MEVALDISPIKDENKVRGVGTYTQNLLESLQKVRGIRIKPFTGEAPTADIVHYPYFDLFFRTLRANNKTKFVVTVHDVIPLIFPSRFKIGPKGKINHYFQKQLLKSASAIICDSQTSKLDIAQKLNYPKESIYRIYLATSANFKPVHDEAKLAVTKNKYQLPREFILYVGDINWNKNIPNLLRAVKLSGTNLVAVGKAIADNNLLETQEINHLIKQLDLENKVIKTGFIEEKNLINLYNLSLATLLPSYYEGFGLTVLESFACGTPVICSNNSSLAEIAKDSAIFCNPDSPEDISAKIISCIQSDKQKVSKKLIQKASKFSWKKVAEETLEVYKKVV